MTTRRRRPTRRTGATARLAPKKTTAKAAKKTTKPKRPPSLAEQLGKRRVVKKVARGRVGRTPGGKPSPTGAGRLPSGTLTLERVDMSIAQKAALAKKAKAAAAKKAAKKGKGKKGKAKPKLNAARKTSTRTARGRSGGGAFNQAHPRHPTGRFRKK